MKKALVTGVTGQDGAYLTELLLNKGYQVVGACRASSPENTWRLAALGVLQSPDLSIANCDITDPESIFRLIDDMRPNEVYNLAAQSSVGVSFKEPLATGLVTGMGAVNILEAIRNVDTSIRFFQASTSEMFGTVTAFPQTELTPFCPTNPYGAAKLYAYWMTQHYKKSYGIFAASGILFNHESPLRGINFVTRKITHGVAQIKSGQLKCLELGNLDAKRDWGYAKDYVEGMYQIMQAPQADNYILATNKGVSVRDFVTMAFKAVKIDIGFEGTGVDEVGINNATQEILVKVNPEFYRPTETQLLIGDASKAWQAFGWASRTNLETLCKIMVDADLDRLSGHTDVNHQTKGA